MTYKEAVTLRENLRTDTAEHNGRAEAHQKDCKQCQSRPHIIKIGNMGLRIMQFPPVKARCAEGQKLAAESDVIGTRWAEINELFAIGKTAYWQADLRAISTVTKIHLPIQFRCAMEASPLGYASYLVRWDDAAREKQQLVYHRTRRQAKERALRLYVRWVADHPAQNARAANRLTRYGYLVDEVPDA